MTTSQLEAVAIPAEYLKRIRAQGHDDYGTPFEVRTGEPGDQLRCCLTHSTESDRFMLISYAPLAGRASGALAPYDEVGPLFVHADECPGYAGNGIPRKWFDGKTKILRAYNHVGGIHGGKIVGPSDDVEAEASRLLADPEVAFLHARNAEYGCFMMEIRKIGEDPAA